MLDGLERKESFNSAFLVPSAAKPSFKSPPLFLGLDAKLSFNLAFFVFSALNPSLVEGFLGVSLLLNASLGALALKEGPPFLLKKSQNWDSSMVEQVIKRGSLRIP